MSKDMTDAAFFVDVPGTQFVFQEWDKDEWEAPFGVIRNGDMRINIRRNLNDEWTVLRYTGDLLGWGVKCDEHLRSYEKYDGLFEWVENPWFEIVSDDVDGEEYGVFDNLYEAEKFCMKLNKKYRKEYVNG